MTSYFLKSDSRLTNILREYSIEAHELYLDGTGTNGVVVSESYILLIKDILNRNFNADINIGNSKPTNYKGIRQVFISSLDSCEDYDEEGPYEDEDDEDYDYDDLAEEIDDINLEIEDLKDRLRVLESRINRSRPATKKEIQRSTVPVPADCGEIIL